MSTMPKQVEEDADAAEELFKTLFEKEAEEAEDADTFEEASGEGDDTSEEQGEQEQEQEEEEEEEIDTYEQRYQSLKGKYDKEVPRLQKKIEELEQLMESSKEGKKEDKTTDDQPKLSDKLDEYREAVGDEMVDIIQNIVSLNTGEATKPLEEKVSSMEQTNLDSKRQEFSKDLSEKSKAEWESLLNGEDEQFMEFLNQTDPNGLYTYGEILDQANKAWDSEKMSKVINLYVDSKQKVDEKKETQKKETAQAAEDALVAPNRKGTSPDPKTDEPRIWTKDQIEQFEKDDRNGKFSKEESDALWNDLLLAPSQGRMR